MIIPEEVFLYDPDYLPTFNEVKIQEEASFLDGCLSYEEEYAKFKYSMGGNLQFYDDHIALTSPRKKPIGKVPRSPFQRSDSGQGDSLLDYSREDSRSSAVDSYISSLSSESMDMSLKGANEQSPRFIERELSTNKSNHKQSSLYNLHHTDVETRKFHENTNVKNNSFNHHKNFERERTLNTEDEQIYVQGGLQSPSSQSQSRCRDYSPIRNEPRDLRSKPDQNNAERNDRTRSKPELHQARSDESRLTNGMCVAEEGCFEKINGISEQNCKDETLKKNDEQNPALVSLLNKEVDKLDRTLMYVNQQMESLHNGDFNDLDIDLSDLSSDVFTDSEQAMTLPLSRLRPNTEFYPDSPTSEHAYSKTPCSTRKNSLNSDLSDDSLSEKDYDYQSMYHISCLYYI